VITGVALGIIRVMVIDDNVKGDIIPADFAVNTILAAAWNTVDEKQDERPQINGSSRVQEAKIYNCVSSPDNPIDWGQIYKYSIDVGKLIPAKRALWIVSWTTVTNWQIYLFLRFFFHLVPAYFVDLYLTMIGKKPRYKNENNTISPNLYMLNFHRLVGLYNKVHKFSEVITYFANSQWTFQNSNMKALMKKSVLLWNLRI
jgi:fatty acyl-CoA reductase